MEKQEELSERKHSVVYVYLKVKTLECIFKETRNGGLITFSVKPVEVVHIYNANRKRLPQE